jgi:hypothetical protein
MWESRAAQGWTSPSVCLRAVFILQEQSIEFDYYASISCQYSCSCDGVVWGAHPTTKIYLRL